MSLNVKSDGCLSPFRNPAWTESAASRHGTRTTSLANHVRLCSSSLRMIDRDNLTDELSVKNPSVGKFTLALYSDPINLPFLVRRQKEKEYSL